jgi:hypothetical protein
LAASSGGKGKKKKWAKGRTKDKQANKVLYDKETHERLLAEAPKVHTGTATAAVKTHALAAPCCCCRPAAAATRCRSVSPLTSEPACDASII